MFSTSGDVQYIGGCSVHQMDTMSALGDIMSASGMFSTSGGYHDECGGYYECIGGCSVHRGDTMSTSDGYHEYSGGCSVHRGDIMIHVREQLDKILSISIENSDVLNIP